MLSDSSGLDLLEEALKHLQTGFLDLPEHTPPLNHESVLPVLKEVAERMWDNFPYPHPLYAGQMLKPPHPVARLAYALAQFINPNNHALDGGRASSQMEKEAVAEIAGMFGWTDFLGHLTSGGTLANLEGLWIAGCLTERRKVLASEQAHYTHERISRVLQLPFQSVGTDSQARMDLQALEEQLRRGDVGTVVATLGTSGVGAVDPLPEILQLCRRYKARCHIDTAYGGYFGLASQLSERNRRVFEHIGEADSVAIDPHKHGLQPYGCGCILFRDAKAGHFYKHDSPYTYFSSKELHLGEISLECSRAGASAVALWATQRLLPLVRGGEFSQGLDSSLRAARNLAARLQQEPGRGWKVLFEPDLDIVIWTATGHTASQVSLFSRAIFDEAARRHLHLALTQLPRTLVAPHWPNLEWDEETVTCLRSCLMKPEHGDWLEAIMERLTASREAAASAIFP